MFNSKRVIHVNCRLTLEYSGEFTSQVSKLVAQDNTSPIYVVINSGGGDVRALRTMVTVLKASECKIITIVYGLAASCASILFLQGKDRIMLQHSELVFHEPSFEMVEDMRFSELKEALKQLEEEYNFFISEMSYATQIDRKSMMEKIKFKTLTLSPTDAVKMRFATKLIETFNDLSKFFI